MTSLIVTSSESTHAESTGKRLTFDHTKNHYTMSTRYEKVELVLEYIDGPSYITIDCIPYLAHTHTLKLGHNIVCVCVCFFFSLVTYLSVS